MNSKTGENTLVENSHVNSTLGVEPQKAPQRTNFCFVIHNLVARVFAPLTGGREGSDHFAKIEQLRNKTLGTRLNDSQVFGLFVFFLRNLGLSEVN